MRKYSQKNREVYINCGEIKCKYPATEKYGLWKNMPEKILSYSGGIQKDAYVLSVDSASKKILNVFKNSF